ncbi:MAG: hypothetical protein ABJH06_05060 [Paraglaciecola sp.]|uniref:hypothetical protein n=1 Tax=Paraglaciecola sp. TaxID=1920173 RepID=UPI00329A349E
MKSDLNIYERDGEKDLLHFELDRLDEYISFFNQHPGKYVVSLIDSLGCELDNIDFISELKGVTHLSLSLYDVNYSPVYRLTGLEFLSFGELSHPLDVSKLSNVTSLFGEWSNKLKNLHGAVNLKNLSLWKYKPKSKDLSELMLMEQLEFLQLVQGNVSALTHIEKLLSLKKLDLHYLRNLHDVSSISNTKLQQLTIDHCSKVSDFGSIGDIATLNKLDLGKVASIPNLNFIHNMKQLSWFSFCGADLVDGQLAMALEHPKLEQLIFHDKKHYSHKYDDFKSLLNSKPH